MADKRGSAGRSDALRVVATIEPDERGRQPEAVVAYAFTNGGRLIGTAPFDKKGVAEIAVPQSAEPSGARLLVGPPLEKPDIGELLRRGAVERHLRLEPKRRAPVELTISPSAWLCWTLSRCTVRGTLLKRTVRDGQSLDLPVCGATVEIYEVDPLSVVLPRIPDSILERMRDALQRIPIPRPEPDPGPFPEPGPFPAPGPVPPGPGPDPAPFAAAADAPAARGTERLAALETPTALRLAATSGSGAQLRRALVDHPQIARPLICWFVPNVGKTLIGTAETDDCGHFTHSFFRGCRNPDEPDLYFRATQRLFFFEVPIYEPTPVACHTHWNYRCGTEVTLYTTSPFARTCAPCPPIVSPEEDWVCVMHVGNLPTSNIRGVAQDLTATTNASNLGLVSDGRPFGGMLRPHLEFDPSLRSRGVQLYRVSVRRQGAAASMPLDGAVHRNFMYDNGGNPVIEQYPLGPKYLPGITEPFYEIPPDVPPQGIWTTADAVENITNAKFPSQAFAPGRPASQPDEAGKFELRIELFDGAGNPATGINWVVPSETDLSSATIINTEAPAAGVVQGEAFVMTLHVDNNVCEAGVDAPTLNGSAASDNCGVMRYSPPHGTAGTVVLPYTARHRNGFATHNFAVQRGVLPLTPPSVGGVPVGGGSFAPTATVQALMSQGLPPGEPPCEIGAFLEAVYVAARATDGWSSRLSAYDASAARAFTLAPESA